MLINKSELVTEYVYFPPFFVTSLYNTVFPWYVLFTSSCEKHINEILLHVNARVILFFMLSSSCYVCGPPGNLKVVYDHFFTWRTPNHPTKAELTGLRAWFKKEDPCHPQHLSCLTLSSFLRLEVFENSLQRIHIVFTRRISRAFMNIT